MFTHAMHRTTVFIIQLLLIIQLQHLKVVNEDLRLQKEHQDTSSKARSACDDE